jgi:dTMP kinase
MSPFISIEGGDGAGKSTQAHLLVDRLKAAGYDALLVREPGGTPLGEALRPLVKGEAPATPLSELMLFETARTELVATVIKPALGLGTIVVSDRFTDSTLAYQGFGRGIESEVIIQLNELATGGLKPDMTLLLDIDPELSLRRVSGANGGRIDPATQRRFESQPIAFHERIYEGFKTLAREEPARWFVIDAARKPERVAEQIWSTATGVLGL